MKRLRECRESLGWSQRKLAELVGCSQQAIQDYEKGRRSPGGDIQVRLSVELGFDIPYLRGETEAPGRADRLPQQWVQAVEWFMAIGLTTDDAIQAVRAWLVAHGREVAEQHPSG